MQMYMLRSPGIWLYRVDKSDVFPCIQEGFQPPYCDAKSPPLVSRKQQRPTTPAAKIASETTTTAIPSKSSPITPAVQRPLPPSIPVFQPQKVEPVGRRPLAKVTPAFPTVESRQWTADSERPPLTSSAAVSSSSSSEEQHHDVFEVTTTQKSRPPPKTSKAPSSIQTAAVDGKKAAGRGSAVEISIEQDHEEEEADQQTADQIVVVPDVVKPDVEKKQLPAGGKGEVSASSSFSHIKFSIKGNSETNSDCC
jgi:hypothetical protein